MSSAATTIDPYRIFRQGSDFAYSASLLGAIHLESMQIDREPIFIQGRQCAVPYVVLSAFAIELYLKCLYLITVGVPKKGTHNLQALFNALPPDQQSKLKLRFDSRVAFLSQEGYPLPTLDPFGKPFGQGYYELDAVLDRISDAFKKFRYIYEYTSESFSFSADGPLIWSLEVELLQIKPEWASYLRARGQPQDLLKLKPHT